MEKLVKELKAVIPFKDTTECGDVLILAAKNPQMLVYAYVTGIERDTSRKDEWWHVEMQILSFPPQQITWTLRTPQMTGMEIFTMGGEERFVKAVLLEKKEEKKISEKPAKKGKGATIVRIK